MTAPTGINCKHYVSPPVPNRHGSRSHRCAVEPNLLTPVTGIMGNNCVDARKEGGVCGPLAANFEPSEGM